MIHRVLADLVVLVHFGFILFVVLGGLAALRWPKVVRVHLPCALYGALISFFGWICPLTPLEYRLRAMADADQGFAGGFVDHYIVPLVYPGPLPRMAWIGVGIAVLALNAVIYAVVLRRRRS